MEFIERNGQAIAVTFRDGDEVVTIYADERMVCTPSNNASKEALCKSKDTAGGSTSPLSLASLDSWDSW